MVESIELSEAQAAEILDELDRQGQAARTGIQRRGAVRLTYRYRVFVAVVEGDLRSTARVQTRNLSRNGLAFITGDAWDPGTQCIVFLATPGNEADRVDATVVRCRQVRDRVHEIGVRFDAMIDTARFVRERKAEHGAV
ncbi:MAG: hypothetical protein CMJ18_27080 [Phycisphaeraceae bacterium]|nr:hypothetical protein [Phycisphaeraceae bacterium]